MKTRTYPSELPHMILNGVTFPAHATKYLKTTTTNILLITPPLPLKSQENPREFHENPREVHSIQVHSIPFQDEDLKTLKTRPIYSDFNIQWYKTHLEDTSVAMVSCKQSRISTIHEQLVRLSLYRIKFLAR